ncbi:MAG: ImmA/IrrE family metallo-endopeptidase [Thiogranum sp.]|nr:ImmA/IrrE family metallo-endopeptidase [Thiogranum sp.]
MFNPGRLSIARKRRQLTKKMLAERAGISQVTLTRIETGQTQYPEEETVAALADALSYPLNFFYLEDCEELPPEAVSFRSLSSLTARQRDAALSAGVIAHLLDDWVTERFNLPQPDLLDLRDEDPGSAAIALRRHWGIGSKPIPHLLKLLEAKGVRVFALAESNKNVDAFSCWRNGVPYVFLNTFKSAERSRFDTAHEIGHLVLHLHGGTSGREVEREADQFASAFLIPRDDFVANVPMVHSLEQLMAHKGRWGVSVAALARTAFEAGVLSDWHYRELCKQISYRGYRTQEPLPMKREESVLWKKVFEELWKERLTKDHIAVQLGIPTDEIASLIGGLLGANDEASTRPKERFKLRAV